MPIKLFKPIGKLTREETSKFYELLDKAQILCQYFEKEHVDENMSDDDWKQYLIDKEMTFANKCSEMLEDL
tara:strand:+ start:283 stop:495 length:213 start_codon:yes stop_codon:yes gene_type:complete